MRVSSITKRVFSLLFPFVPFYKRTRIFKLLSKCTILIITLYSLFQGIWKPFWKQYNRSKQIQLEERLFQYRKEHCYPNICKGILLHDGRWLSYNEVGNCKSNKVVFLFHSLGSSRLEMQTLHSTDSVEDVSSYEKLAESLHLRIIHVDRPGLGQSTPHLNRTYLSFAQDIDEMATLLNIKQYTILGISSGAPFALASAFFNETNSSQNRVLAVGCISSELPYESLALDEFSPYLKDIWFLTKYVPFLLKFFLKHELYRTVFAFPEKYSEVVLRDQTKFYSHEGEDLDLYLKYCVDCLREGMLKHGIEESIREIEMERKNWGFSLQQIQHTPILFFHGKKNKIVRFALLRKVMDTFFKKNPNVQLIDYKNKGQFFYLNPKIWHEILSHMNSYFAVDD